MSRKKVLLFGTEAQTLQPLVEQHDIFELVEEEPDTVICYGGDGTLLAAELHWPGVPKVPIRNSRRGHRCIPHPPGDVIARLAGNQLVCTQYLKLECALFRKGQTEPEPILAAMNEFNLHMGKVNLAVRFHVWIDDLPYEDDLELVGDGFVVCTPFGSTAYFNQITHGLFQEGVGVAFKYVREHTNHMVLPEYSVIRVLITRGPAVLAFDNSPRYIDIKEGDELVFRKHAHAATLLTWEPMKHPIAAF